MIWVIRRMPSGCFERADKEWDGLDFFVGNAGIWPPEDDPHLRDDR